MVEKDVLNKIVFLKDLPDIILEKIGAIAQLEIFDEESILFRQNQEQKLLYMLISGKVFLNSRSAVSGKSLTLDEVSAGRTFGVSALIGKSSSTFTAICAETCSIVTVSGEQMRHLFEQDFEIGHALMVKVVEFFRSRMEMHTQQFLHSLATHPEIRRLH